MYLTILIMGAQIVTSLAALVGCVLATMLWYRTRSFYTGMNGGREMTRGDYGEL